MGESKLTTGQTPFSEPLIKRLKKPAKPIISLSPDQTSAVARFQKAMDGGSYQLTSNPCLCGERNDTLVACCDRYGLDVKTVICRSCGLMRTDPCLTEESMTLFYERDYRAIYGGSLEAPSEVFDQEVARGMEIIRFLETSGISPVGRVLEVGCCAGGILQAFRQRGCEVAGCDFERSSLEYGRQRGVPLVKGNSTRLTHYAPATIIILAHVVEHFRDPVKELSNLRSLLDKNGYLYIEAPGLFNIEKAYAWSDLGRYLQNAHVHHFCLESLDYILSLAGFFRMAGDERITAIYGPGESRSLFPQGLAQRTIKYLKQLERHQQYKKLGSYVLAPIGKIFNQTFLHRQTA